MEKLTESTDAFKGRPPSYPLTWNLAENPLEQVVSTDDLAEIFDEVIYQKDSIRLVLDGNPVNPSTYTRQARTPDAAFSGEILPYHIATHLDQGSSVAINNLERYSKPLREFVRELVAEIGTNVECVGFLTPPGNTGFAAHADPTDVLVYQVSGYKRWTVYKPLPEGVEFSDFASHAANSSPYLEVTLGPGDCLWIPRDWVHVGRASQGDTHSWHVSFVFWPRTYDWLVAEILSSLARQENVPHLRENLPWGAALNDEVMRIAIQSALKRIKEGLDYLDVSQAMKNAQVKLRLALPSPRYPLIQEKIDKNTALRIIPESVLSLSRCQNGSVRLNLARTVVTLKKPAADVFLPILVGGDASNDRIWRPADFIPSISERASVEIAKKLYRLGVARVVK
ncbi:JmjC domain-containing protein [Streptomyces cadmiisoli]|uniref:JmjC domain-containing protein n=1 Tax=Streptomyces cadmiisoli TaxID=2184053 RepID=A0A2Z4JF63_9ACTN|nr:cupin domain-containing protein [Streptomyces cadmiisoli]AWW43558.1 hypothetical protein DN051_44435 [Streptomyces cadmiisoli]